MEVKDQQATQGETSTTEKQTNNGSSGEVVINIPTTDEETSKANLSSGSQNNIFTSKAPEMFPRSVSVGRYPYPDTTLKFIPSKNKPPQIPTSSSEYLTRRMSFARPVYFKTKSRFGEHLFGHDYQSVLEEENSLSHREQETIEKSYSNTNSLNRESFNNNSINSVRTHSERSKAPSGVEDDEEEICKKVELIMEKRRRFSFKGFIQIFLLFCLCVFLVTSLTIDALKEKMIWEMHLWKWCVVVIVTFFGMLVTNWFIHVVVFLIERNFLLRKKVLYFVHGLKRSAQVFIWIGLILLAWIFLINHGCHRTKNATRILEYVTWTLVTLLIGSFLWLIKTFLLKLLASNFHVKTFFDRIQESVFHQYVLQTLSGPPLIEEARMVGKIPNSGLLSFRSRKKGKDTKNKKVIDMGKLQQMKQEKVSAWTMKVLVDAVLNSGLSTISNVIDESVSSGRGGKMDKEITNEMEAIAAAYNIFQNVAQPGSKFIEEEDLLRFMIKEEVDLVLPLFEGYENGRINRKDLTKWVINVYHGRQALAHALSDAKTAVKQLSKLVTGVLILVTIVIWLLLMEIASTKLLFFLLSQIALISFMFGTTCKAIFEAIIFVFVMHPFDVGDRCLIDGVPMLVEEMNILTTVFLKLDNEKVYYPNSVLATKPISNFYRSPDMGDSLELSIGFETPLEKIGLFKEKIKEYLERTPQYWYPKHVFVVKEIENVNKLKLLIYFYHTINYQNYAERLRRRTEFALEMKRILEELGIKYNLLPQKVLLNPIYPDQHM